jgi:hypothetical protein
VLPHGRIDDSGDPALGRLRSDCVANAKHDELLLVAGGHWTSPVRSSYKGSEVIAETGQRVWKIFSNWQEQNRHNGGKPSWPDGVTASTARGVYTVITISPSEKNICAHDWNPYFQPRSERGNGQEPGGIALTELCEELDFDARF